MKLLHTSDWHIGQKFMGKSRKEEHLAFFSWLYETIKEQKIDVLLVSGDIFDTGTPPNYALELYYNFLTKLYSIKGLHTIITAGNHDSISTLKAPKSLLGVMNISIIASGENEEREPIVISKNKKPIAIICAVPFLRDATIRASITGQTLDDKENALSIGIKKYYDDIYQKALALQTHPSIPIVAMGHLTTLGGKSSDSEREIYIGGALNIGVDFWAKRFDYVALGHLHQNQSVKFNHLRYSGSPLALSFSESTQIKRVNVISFNKKNISVEEITIPQYRELKILKGNLENITKSLQGIEEKQTWIEIHLEDNNPMFANSAIREEAKRLNLQILAIKIKKNQQQQTQENLFPQTNLEELTPLEIFKKRLEEDKIENESFQKTLILKFKEIAEKVTMQ